MARSTRSLSEKTELRANDSPGAPPMEPRLTAPEPWASAYLEVLRRAILQVRVQIRCDKPMSGDQVHDLMDAVHNIPKFLTQRNDFFTVDVIRQELESYDRKWAASEDDFSLIRILDTALGDGSGTPEDGST